MLELDYIDSGIRKAFRTDGVLLIHGMFDQEEVIGVREKLKITFDHSRDGEGEIRPWSKAQSFRHEKEGKLPRLVRMIYEPPTRDIFQRLVEFRNHLTGKPPMWAWKPEDGWWTASRFNQYPKGVGFMDSHSDGGYIGSEPPGGYAQTLLVMTEYGVDYKSGGGFFESDGCLEMVDRKCEIGDVLVYDGKVRHGVSLIDPGTPVDLTTLNGRIVATVTTLKVL